MIQSLNTIINTYAQSVTGQLSVGFVNLQTGERLFAHGDKPFPTASTFKIFVLAEVLRQAEAGILNLTDRIRMTESHKSVGSGVLYDLMPDLELTVADLAMLMMTISDNTATDMLFELVGRDNIKTYVIDGMGLTHTQCDFPCKELIARYYGATITDTEPWANALSYNGTPYFLCQTEKNNATTPADMATLLTRVYQKTLFSPWVCDEMLRIMKRCQTNTRIPKFLPPSVTAAHKTGSLDRVANDCGIVFTPKGDYVIVLSYNGNAADDAEYAANRSGRDSDRLLAELSRDMYHSFVSGS